MLSAALLPAMLLTAHGAASDVCGAQARGPVVIHALGLGTATAADPTCQRWVVEGEESGAVAYGALDEVARATSTPAGAQRALDVLREDEARALAGTDSLYSSRSLDVLERGDLNEQAIFLRELYATGGQTSSQLEAIAHLESIVLPELAFVLGLEADALKSEMRLRHRRR